MKILKIKPVGKNDKAVRRNTEVVPKSYFSAIFEYNNKTYTATMRISTNHIAECVNENDERVSLKEETEEKLIDAIREYNKKLELESGEDY